jgi:hypothetical protein
VILLCLLIFLELEPPPPLFFFFCIICICKAHAGEIVVVAGLEFIKIGDTIMDVNIQRPMTPIHVEEPTVKMTFRWVLICIIHTYIHIYIYWLENIHIAKYVMVF